MKRKWGGGEGWNSQLPSALGGAINLELWETDEALCFFILQQEELGVQSESKN